MKSVGKNMADFELHAHYSHGILTDHGSNACGRHFPLPLTREPLIFIIFKKGSIP
jgi:hypothetical protein